LCFDVGGGNHTPVTAIPAFIQEPLRLAARFVATRRVRLPETARLAIRGELRALVEGGVCPGAALLLRWRGAVVMREAHGVARLETREPFRVSTPCWLASASKTFTATLVAMLADEGVLSLDDPIARFYPEFDDIRLQDGSKPSEPVRIRHALGHTTGIPWEEWLQKHGMRDDPDYAGFFTPRRAADFIDACLRIGLIAEPGTRITYGRPINLITCVVERATGRPFASVMEERVFARLGLTHTTIRLTRGQLPALTPVYHAPGPRVFDPDPFSVEVARQQVEGMSSAGGGIYSTGDDIGRMLQLHLNRGRHGRRQLVRPETVEQLLTPQPVYPGYGLGFQIHDTDVNGASRIVCHAAYSGPLLWFDRGRDLVGTLLMQCCTADRDAHHRRLLDTVNRFVPVSLEHQTGRP
jgi:CubicO group peptidase (beta-lactamase class C family)